MVSKPEELNTKSIKISEMLNAFSNHYSLKKNCFRQEAICDLIPINLSFNANSNDKEIEYPNFVYTYCPPPSLSHTRAKYVCFKVLNMFLI